jgi:small subunit ribosomal protein S16
MVRIRLRRVGAKNQPSYRVVVADGRSPRDGRFIEKIGFYNPRTEPSTIEIDEERALHWLSSGAQPSGAVRRLLVKTGTMDRFERLRKGEALEVDPRTRRDDVVKAPKKAVAEAEPAVSVEEVAVEVSEEIEAEESAEVEVVEEETEEEEAEEAADSEDDEEAVEEA